jgi:hypothetical protein
VLNRKSAQLFGLGERLANCRQSGASAYADRR